MSLIERAIATITEDHRLDPDTDSSKSSGDCELRSGLETAFVGLTADYVLEEVRNRTPNSASYHHWVYMPSRRAEGVTGYDLSLGHFERWGDATRRVRSMHKLLLSWCDNRWRRTFNPGTRDHEHLVALVEDYRRNLKRRAAWATDVEIRPFLIIHICGCVHEYRRMGLRLHEFEVPEIVIPDIDSLLRTVVIPLAEVAELSEPLEELSVRYRRDTTGRGEEEASQEYLDRIAAPDNHHAVVLKDDQTIASLNVISLSEWREEIVNFLLSERDSSGHRQ
jgi:hypothetical protein